MITGRQIFAASLFALCPLNSLGVDFSFTGSSKEIIPLSPDKNSGLEKIFVAYDTSELSGMVISGVAADVTVSKYSNLGGGFSMPVSFSIIDGNAVVDSPEGNVGYIVESAGRTTCVWLVNYLPYKFSVSAVRADDAQECENTRIMVEGSGAPIHYYSIDGRQCELSRDIAVSYYNLEWSEESESFAQVTVDKQLNHLSNPVILTPPLYCSSVIDISGDRFLKQWGMETSLESSAVQPNGLEVMTSATQTNAVDDDPDSDASNMINSDTQGLGGSAPADFSFKAWTTDAVIHNEWQIASDQNFEYIDYRFNEQNLDYTFTEEGTYYVRFVGSNSDGSCEAVGETYTIGIGSSDLRIPNAFTPNEDGVNDVWKVGYRSLISFNCTIFDRYGNQIYKFSDPTQGWDGKHKGKYVKPGVYFYVIEAKGADGKEYKRGGDINIIKSKRYSNSSSASPVQ